MNTRTQTLFYEYIKETEPADLGIHEVTTGVVLSMETSPTTESIALLNPEINPEKHEHPCQIEDLNPDKQVPRAPVSNRGLQPG
jgi:hypothetical protein